MYVNSCTIQNQLQNIRKIRCVKNYTLSLQFLIGFTQHALLAPQPIHQKAKQNVFKFLNARNLLLTQCKKFNVLQQHVSPVAFPMSHWLGINNRFIYNHLFFTKL
jgi:hypothetical protein